MRPAAPLGRGISPARSVAYLLGVWATAASALALYAVFPSALTFVVAFVVVASRQHALLIIEHECWHYNMFNRRRTNDFVGSLLSGWAAGSPYFKGRQKHLDHHRHLGSASDPDLGLHSRRGKEDGPKLVRYLLSHLLGGQVVYTLLDQAGPHRGAGSSDRDPASGGAGRGPGGPSDLLGLCVVQLVILTVVTSTIGWWGYPLLWFLPLLTLTAFFNGVRSLVEHYCFDGDDVAKADRLFSVKSSWWERFFFSPMNFNYHAEHHLRPTVSAFSLPALREQFIADGQVKLRGGYLSLLREIIFGTGSRPPSRDPADR